MPLRPLLIRADASREIGTGHVMRCLALAQAWQDGGGTAVFAMAQSTPALTERLRSTGFEVQPLQCGSDLESDASQVTAIASRISPGWLVVDGYHFGLDYQHALKNAGMRILLIDDDGTAARYHADLILNQNLHANEHLYRELPTRTQVLLGPRYAMLRREFQAWRNWKRVVKTAARNILVTMGGSDPLNVTAPVLQLLNDLKSEELEIRVVVGGSSAPHENLKEVTGRSRHHVRILSDVQNMNELMLWADVAVAAAGSTAWEMCRLGLPAVLVHNAENQKAVASSLDRAGAAIHVGSGRDLLASQLAGMLDSILASASERQNMADRAQELVDGYGTARLVAFMDDEVSLRTAREEDCRTVWEWANDASVRQASFTSEAIPWEHHVKWFAAQLTDPNSKFYIVLDEAGKPIGQIRFRMGGCRATISISLEKSSRGHGRGFKALTLATEQFFGISVVQHIDAFVKPENERSVSLFQQAGFRDKEDAQVNGQAAVHFELPRSGFAN